MDRLYSYITDPDWKDQSDHEGKDCCFECGKKSEFFADSYYFSDIGLCTTHAMVESENEIF